MFSKDTSERPQPIEGAKGNIAMVCYRGKYVINKSMDDDTYQLESVPNAFKCGSGQLTAQTLTDMWLFHNDSTKRYIFRLLRITPDEEPDDSNAHLWYDTSNAEYLTALLSEPRFRGSWVLIQKHQQNDDFHYLDGWYACEKLMLKFAGWLNEAFDTEIYEAYAMSPEHERLRADNGYNHKDTRIEELESMLKQQDSKLDRVIERLRVMHDHVIEVYKILGEQNMKLHNMLHEQNAKSCDRIIEQIKRLYEQNKQLFEQNVEIFDMSSTNNIQLYKLLSDKNLESRGCIIKEINQSLHQLQDQLLTGESAIKKLVCDNDEAMLKGILEGMLKLVDGIPAHLTKPIHS